MTGAFYSCENLSTNLPNNEQLYIASYKTCDFVVIQSLTKQFTQFARIPQKLLHAIIEIKYGLRYHYKDSQPEKMQHFCTFKQ